MKKNKLLSLSAIVLICFSMTNCDNKSNNENIEDVITLNVYNCADYISETETIDGEKVLGTMDQFVEYCKTTLNKNVEIKYSTYETNEDLYNQLKAGGIDYDLVCPSEYMIEKMLINDMLLPLDKKVENYETYGSPYIKEVFNGLKTKVGEKEVNFADYAIPYMWGTMGFMYNPNAEGIEEAIHSWDIIWDENFKNKTSLKDSIRDTYITGTFHVFKEELELIKKLYDDGYYSDAQYNQHIADIMNRCDDDTLVLVEAALKKAKENIYEFEVDTGKENIIKGKYDVNLCWSGDAVYALDLAEEEDFYLNYVIPEEGSNIWFDGWVIPKSSKNPNLAQELMNFICRPEIARQNMEYIGYTSAIAGQEIWELVQEWYEAEDGEATTEYDLTYFFNGTGIVDENNTQLSKFVINTAEVNRQLYAQYPDAETIKRCAVMKDFGTQADAVSEMWIRVKGNSASWVIFVFLGVIVAFVILFEVKNSYSKRARKNRNKNR